MSKSFLHTFTVGLAPNTSVTAQCADENLSGLFTGSSSLNGIKSPPEQWRRSLDTEVSTGYVSQLYSTDLSLG